ncbi:predicted protein [Plenodomus lingam JN3]|uniref:Uncharacterized protein n=1 Tax=Leptosphaeria maculans (strain JN3 / isolate v23.1.3 / race Av1-4-5-6-7-8) TaxID=985895 RepID=E4ZFU5_LEPMJ|nr:predicted protein [Plenodomus lingam JN3]CBX90165.1 predicted protein [Plenodomus lingam JN3]
MTASRDARTHLFSPHDVFLFPSSLSPRPQQRACIIRTSLCGALRNS